MTYVIAESCIDVPDRACVDQFPVDWIYEGAGALYIHRDERVDCGAREPMCPVEAILYQEGVPSRWAAFADGNARFLTDPLLGRDHPVASPGGAGMIGRLGVDTAWSPATHR